MHKIENIHGRFSTAEINGNTVCLTSSEKRDTAKVVFTPPKEFKYISITHKNDRLKVNVFDRNDRLTHSQDFCLSSPPSQIRLRRRSRVKQGKLAAAKRKHEKSAV